MPLVAMMQLPGWIYANNAVAFGYNAVILWILIPRYPKALYGGYLPCTLDLIAISIAIYSDGGIKSSFYVIYFLAVVICVFRFPNQYVLFTPAAMAITYSGAVIAANGGDWQSIGTVVFRMVWVTLTGLFANIMVTRTRTAQKALASELGRTRLLLQAAYAPTTSLTVNGVLDAILEQVTRLIECDSAVVCIDDAAAHPGILRWVGDEDLAPSSLGGLLMTDRRVRQALLRAAGPVTPGQLADNLSIVPAELRRLATLCAAEIRSDAESLGVIVTARSSSPLLSIQHYEALTAFLQRASLAIQNARLYEQLQAQMDELRSLHDQVVASERLAALGQLAAKVAHELNNPLASIHMYNSLMMEGPMTAEEQAHLAESVEEQVERAKQVVMEVLDYSRPRPSMREVMDPNDALRYGLRLVQHAARPAHVTIVEEYAPDLPVVLLDRGHIAQIVTNLTLNAIQAMPNGGTLTISTGTELGEVFLRFRDTGVGIAPADEERVFDAFFTTKAPGQGTGLGLAVCRSLVTQHRGRITVDSEQGIGSTFTIWLPPATVEEEMVVGSHSR